MGYLPFYVRVRSLKKSTANKVTVVKKITTVKKRTALSLARFPHLQQGQRWDLTESNIQIGMVGKRLVHYKHFKGGLKRAPVSIASIPVLENYLQQNKAVLTQQAPAVAVVPAKN